MKKTSPIILPGSLSPMALTGQFRKSSRYFRQGVGIQIHQDIDPVPAPRGTGFYGASCIPSAVVIPRPENHSLPDIFKMAHSLSDVDPEQTPSGLEWYKSIRVPWLLCLTGQPGIE